MIQLRIELLNVWMSTEKKTIRFKLLNSRAFLISTSGVLIVKIIQNNLYLFRAFFVMLRAPFCWFFCCPVSLRSSCIMILVYFTAFQCSIIGGIFVVPEMPFSIQMILLSWNVFVILWILVALYGIDQRKPKLLIPQALLQKIQLLLLSMVLGYAIGVFRDKFSPSVYSDIAYLSVFSFVVALNGYFIVVIDSYYEKMFIE